jgi:hypothetical protein
VTHDTTRPAKVVHVGKIGKDTLAGAMFIAIGLAFAVAASDYTIGTALRMGPGYFPLVLGGLLVLLGVLTVVKGFVAPDEGELGPVPWRALALLLGAVVFFGYAVRGLGLLPTLFLTTFLAAFAGYRARLMRALVTATGLTVMCWLIFVEALQLRLPLLGTWIGG